MFDQTFVNAQAQTRRPWTVALSLALQTSLVAAALIIPILRVAPLNAPPKIPVWLPVQKLDLRMKPEIKAAVPETRSARPVFRLATILAPTRVPDHINLAPDAPELAVVAGGLAITSLNTLLPGLATQPVPPPSTPPVKLRPAVTTPAVPVRVGGGVQAARLIFGPKPSYPILAKTTRTQGTVRMQALIGRDGIIRNLQLVSGPPLLVAAAMEAVGRWRYQPTLLNGEAVEVITEIDVNFTLSQ